MSRSRGSRVTKKNPNLTGSGVDLMDFDDSILYNDYLTSGTAIRVGPNAPDLAEYRDGIFLYGFAGTGAIVEEGMFTLHFLHDIHPDHTPTFHIHWTHNNASPSGDVKWQLDYTYSHGYSAGTYGAPTTLSVTQTAGAQYTHHITDDDAMPVSVDFEPDGMLLCRIYRDPADVADTFADDAFLIGVDMHYRVGQIATYERNRPFNSAGF